VKSSFNAQISVIILLSKWFVVALLF